MGQAQTKSLNLIQFLECLGSASRLAVSFSIFKDIPNRFWNFNQIVCCRRTSTRANSDHLHDSHRSGWMNEILSTFNQKWRCHSFIYLSVLRWNFYVTWADENLEANFICRKAASDCFRNDRRSFNTQKCTHLILVRAMKLVICSSLPIFI